MRYVETNSSKALPPPHGLGTLPIKRSVNHAAEITALRHEVCLEVCFMIDFFLSLIACPHDAHAHGAAQKLRLDNDAHHGDVDTRSLLLLLSCLFIMFENISKDHSRAKSSAMKEDCNFPSRVPALKSRYLRPLLYARISIPPEACPSPQHAPSTQIL